MSLIFESGSVYTLVKYTEDAFKTFLEACENRRKNGADESEIVVPTSSPAQSPYMKKKKSFARLVWLFLSSAIKKRVKVVCFIDTIWILEIHDTYGYGYPLNYFWMNEIIIVYVPS